MQTKKQTIIRVVLQYLAALSWYYLGKRSASRAMLTCAWCGRPICEYRYLAAEAGWNLIYIHTFVCAKAAAAFEVVTGKDIQAGGESAVSTPGVDWAQVRKTAEARGWVGGPHCDSDVLHAPGTCDACDAYPTFQALRTWGNMNFTGEHDPAKKPCPSEQKRPLESIEKWPNNRPYVDPAKASPS